MQWKILSALVDLDGVDVFSLINSLDKSQDDILSEAIVRSLGKIRNPVAVPTLIRAFQVPVPRLQDAIIQSFESIVDPNSISLIASNFDDYQLCYYGPFLHFRIAKNDANNKEIVIRLIKIMSSKSEDLRRNAAKALGEISDPLAIPKLDRLKDKDKDYDVRSAAVKSLQRMQQSDLDHYHTKKLIIKIAKIIAMSFGGGILVIGLFLIIRRKITRSQSSV